MMGDDEFRPEKVMSGFAIVADAAGPEQIRAGLAAAIDAADEHTDHIDGLARVLTGAADWYESLQMAGTTVGHLRTAAAALTTGCGHLGTAGERLQAAAADFDARDGQVAAAVATAGNLMDAAGYTESILGEPTATPIAAHRTGHPVTAVEQEENVPQSSPARPSPEDTMAAGRPSSPGPDDDRLHLAGRAKLGPGETVLASRHLPGGGPEDELCLILVVQTPDGPRVRLGVGIPAADRAAWRGADLGATVVLDADAAGQLHQQLPQLHSTAKQAQEELARRAQDEDGWLLVRMGYESARYPQVNPAELVFAQQGHDDALREAAKLRDQVQREVVAKLTDNERNRWAAFDEHISRSTDDQMRRWHLMLEQLAIARGLTRKQLDRSLELEERYNRRDITSEESRERDTLLAAPGGLPRGAERRDVVFVLSQLNKTVARAEDRRRKVAELTADPVPLDAETQAELQQAVQAHELASRRLNEMPEVAGQITVPGQWGDLVVQAVLNDDVDDQPYYQMAVRAPGCGDDWDPALSADAYYTGSYRQARRIAAALQESLADQDDRA